MTISFVTATCFIDNNYLLLANHRKMGESYDKPLACIFCFCHIGHVTTLKNSFSQIFSCSLAYIIVKGQVGNFLEISTSLTVLFPFCCSKMNKCL